MRHVSITAGDKAALGPVKTQHGSMRRTAQRLFADESGQILPWAALLMMFLLVTWIFFRAPSLGAAGEILSAMAGHAPAGSPSGLRTIAPSRSDRRRVLARHDSPYFSAYFASGTSAALPSPTHALPLR